GIFFFLLFLSTIHFITPVFLAGFIFGIGGIVLTLNFPETGEASIIADNFLYFLYAFLLSGIVYIIIIHLYIKLLYQFVILFILYLELDSLYINLITLKREKQALLQIISYPF